MDAETLRRLTAAARDDAERAATFLDAIGPEAASANALVSLARSTAVIAAALVEGVYGEADDELPIGD
jgi:hypothetical protein